jgi:hypothetical protein
MTSSTTTGMKVRSGGVSGCRHIAVNATIATQM